MRIPSRLTPGRRGALRAALALTALAPCAPVLAQELAQERSFTLTPTFTADESYVETRGRISDNGREAITRIAPGLRLASRSGRVQGALDYAGSLLYRIGRGTEGSEFQNVLNGAFVVEALPNWAFIDARASISQQALSAFGQQSVEGSLQSNANRTEVSTFTLSPYVRGQIGALAEYEVRLSASATDTRSEAAPGSSNSGASVVLRSSRRGAMLGWALSATQERSEFNGSAAGATDDSRVNASAIFSPAPEVQLSVSGGRESIDEGQGVDRRSLNTTGLGLQWSPSQRTSLSASIEQRFFGRSKRVSFQHRMPRTVWTYSLNRDVNKGADGLSIGQPLTLFQLLYEQQASAIPDPDQRTQFVLDDLASKGLDPNQLVAVGFLTSSRSVQRRQDLGIIWLGQRTTFSLRAYSSASTQLVSVGSADPSAGEALRQHGYSSTLSYRLTPNSSVSMGGSRATTFATANAPGNDLKSASLSLTSQVGRRTSAQLGARYTVFNSPVEPYRETSLTGSLSLRY